MRSFETVSSGSSPLLFTFSADLITPNSTLTLATTKVFSLTTRSLNKFVKGFSSKTRPKFPDFLWLSGSNKLLAPILDWFLMADEPI